MDGPCLFEKSRAQAVVEPVVEPATFSTNGEHLTSLSQNLPILLVMYCNCDLGIENNPPPQLRIWLNLAQPVPHLRDPLLASWTFCRMTAHASKTIILGSNCMVLTWPLESIRIRNDKVAILSVGSHSLDRVWLTYIHWLYACNKESVTV